MPLVFILLSSHTIVTSASKQFRPLPEGFHQGGALAHPPQSLSRRRFPFTQNPGCLNKTAIIRKKETNQCIKCKSPTMVFQSGKRKGENSIYCLKHLLQQRERNRLGARFKRWIETGGDPAAWNAVKEWLARRFTAVQISNIAG